MNASLAIKISIITVCYNILEAGRKDFFKQMLDSIHNQTYANIEHIIVDGASNDGSVEYINAMLEPYKHRSIVFVSEPDTGIYDAMNKGWRLATGDYVAYLNSDDFYHDLGGIERVVKKIRQKAPDCLCSAINIVKSNQKRCIMKPNMGMVLMHMPLAHPGFFVMRRHLEELNGFDHKRFKLAGDYDLVLRLVLNKQITWTQLSKPFASFRLGGFSSDVQLNQIETAEIFKKNYAQYLPNYTNNDWVKLSKTRRLPIRLLIRLRHKLSVQHYYWLLKWHLSLRCWYYWVRGWLVV
jgi:glycosyltransferase involved in cell wall biosynthesis